MNNFSRKFFFLIIINLVILLRGYAFAEPSGVLIPFYVYPTQEQIQPLLNVKNANPEIPIRVILNPSSGVGNSIDPNYVTAINTLQQAGIKVVGYVYTAYNERPITDVECEINKWRRWYHPDGIFLDGMGTNLSYYQDVTTFAKAIGLSFTIGSPGTDVPINYADVVDTLVVATTAAVPNLQDYSKWNTTTISKTKIGMLVYNIPNFPTSFVNEAKKFVGWLYVTDKGSTSDPWQSLSSYLGQLAATLKANANPMGTLIPFYLYPTNSALQPLINARLQYPNVPIRVILNPNSGPGDVKDPVYVNAVTQLKKAGISVLGYVSTSYGNRSGTTVKTEISRWINWYQPDGIFLDEMGLKHSYYQSLTTYAKSYGIKYVVGNPGANIDVSAGNDVDNVVVFESNYLPSLNQFQNWRTAFPQSKISMLNHGIANPQESYMREASKYFSWIYFTPDGADGNPWDGFPVYFQTFVQILNNINQ